MSTRRTDAYMNDPDCQAFEEAQHQLLTAWLEDMKGKRGLEAQHVLEASDAEISAARKLRDTALAARGLVVDEHFEDHNVWVIDLVALEAEP